MATTYLEALELELDAVKTLLAGAPESAHVELKARVKDIQAEIKKAAPAPRKERATAKPAMEKAVAE